MKKLFLFPVLLAVFLTATAQTEHLAIPAGGDPFATEAAVFPVLTADPLTDAVNAWVIPGQGAGSTNTRAPGNASKYQRTEYLITPAEMAASGFPAGQTIDAIGFLIQTAGGTTQTGNFKVWLMNTGDVTYTLGTNWTTSGFTLVSDIASWTVPIAVGSYVVNFSGGVPFTYTGGGVYVAWEFSNPGTAGATALTANCNVNLVNGLYGNRSATALPTSLTASNYRPATLFVNNTLVDILQVTNIYAQEKCPIPFGIPTNLSARVSNVSASPESFNATMTIMDQATSTVRYTNTQSVTALAGGSATVITFTPWTATLQENVNITVTVAPAAGENHTINNTLTIPTNINNNLFGYCYSLNANNGYGYTYTGAGGIFANKFHMNGTGTVPSANLFIYNTAPNTGNTIYAVVLNSAGVIVAQSANYVITAGDLGTNKNFTFPTVPTFINEDFYVGLAQPPGGTVQWYPMGVMAEVPYRANTYYNFGLTGGTPTARTTDYKLMIEAEVASAVLLPHDVGTLSIDMARVITTGNPQPLATVKNFGSSTETFTVNMTIGGGYSSTQTVTNLVSGGTTQVVFDPWTNSLGDYTVNVCTQLATDMEESNNCLTREVKVLNLNKPVYGYLAFAGTGSDPVGPIVFNLSTPGTLNSLANQSTEQFVSGGTWANGQWYGTVYNTVAPYNLVTLDPTTGVRTVIGDMGVSMNGLSYNTANSTLYAVSGTSLYTVDMATAAATLVGANTGVTLIGLAINNEGQAYAIDIVNDMFGSINLTTGLFTTIGPLGYNLSYAQDMEFERETGNLFVTAYQSSGWLGWVNTTTGQLLKIGDFEGGGEVTGFAIPYSSVPVNYTVTGIVGPEQNPCFNATNTLTVGGTSPFTVQSTGSVTLIAGVNILLMPGTTVEPGATLHGYISGTFCGGADLPLTAAEPTAPVAFTASFVIYPNPSDKNVEIARKGGTETGSYHVTLYSMNGKAVLSMPFTGETPGLLPTEDLPAGIYFMRISSGDQTETVKFIKTR